MTARKAARTKLEDRNDKFLRVTGSPSMPAARRQMLIDQARWLDLEADVKTQHGHHSRGDLLSRRAAELRDRT